MAEADCGGVRWLGLAGRGEVDTLFGRDFLLLFLLVDLGFAGWDPGAGLALLDFMGVVGKPMGVGMSVRASPSEAYVLRPLALPPPLPRRAGVCLLLLVLLLLCSIAKEFSAVSGHKVRKDEQTVCCREVRLNNLSRAGPNGR